MVERGAFTLAEIMRQRTVWEDALRAFSAQTHVLRHLGREHNFDQVIFTGCGSTDYLAIFGVCLFQSLLRIPAQARPASELILFPDLVYIPGQQALLVVVSRSGETSETREAVE